MNVIAPPIHLECNLDFNTREKWTTCKWTKLFPEVPVDWVSIFSFAHLGDGKTLGLLTNVRDDDDDSHYHFRQVYWTGVLDRCTRQVY